MCKQNPIAVSLFLLQFSLFISTWEERTIWEDIYHSAPHVSVITGNILITTTRFDRYHLLLASNSTFMTDSMYLDIIQIYRNLNEHYYYLVSTTSVI